MSAPPAASSAASSVLRSAITEAAVQMGVPDPIAVANQLIAVAVEALLDWFGIAARAGRALAEGTAALQDVIPLLGQGWSNDAPHQALRRRRDAGLAARGVVAAQVDAAEQAADTLRRSRSQAELALSDCEMAIAGLGWPPGEELLPWAARNGGLPTVVAAIGTLVDGVTGLRSRNDEALHALALALRANPRDPVEQLLEHSPDAAIAGGPVDASGSAAASRPDGSVDQENLRRLDADLHSSDVSTLAMALGVSAAMQKARADGGVAQLLVYESANRSSQGRAAISLGDITTADNVVALAPGVSNAPVNMSDGLDGATALRNAAQRQAPEDRTAVVAWYGYDIPLAVAGGVPMGAVASAGNIAGAVNDVHARVGGVQLTRDIETFRQWAPDDARFVGVGFSMGSTTVSAAAARGAAFDDVVLLGSPGASVDVRTAADYPDITPEHVFVTSFDQDPITRGSTDLVAGIVGGVGLNPLQPSPFGPDPAEEEFGAQVVDAPSGAPDVSVSIGGGLWGALSDLVTSGVADEAAELASHHNEANYLSGESGEAVAAVAVGHYTDVPIKPGR